MRTPSASRAPPGATLSRTARSAATSRSPSHVAKCRCTARRYVTFISRHSSRPRRVSSTMTERWSSSTPVAADHPALLREPVEPAAEARRTSRSSSASSLGRAAPPQRCSAASTSNQPSERSHSARRSASIAAPARRRPTAARAMPPPGWRQGEASPDAIRVSAIVWRVSFLSTITGSFSTPAGGNPTVAMIEAAYRAASLDARYVNCEVAPDDLADAVRGARPWAGSASIARSPQGRRDRPPRRDRPVSIDHRRGELRRSPRRSVDRGEHRRSGFPRLPAHPHRPGRKDTSWSSAPEERRGRSPWRRRSPAPPRSPSSTATQAVARNSPACSTNAPR